MEFIQEEASRASSSYSRYRSDSEDQNDGVLCIICNHNEPEELSSEMVFWIDCNVCGAWVHT